MIFIRDKINLYIVILHNLRSLYNVGAIFRTADACGVNKIFLTGRTPSPISRFGKIKPMFKKTALGAQKFISWEKYSNLTRLVKKLKTQKILIIGAEQTPDAVQCRRFYFIHKNKLKKYQKVAILFGSETSGFSFKTIQKADMVVKIPMIGKKESLNVSVAAGIILYEFAYILNRF